MDAYSEFQSEQQSISATTDVSTQNLRKHERAAESEDEIEVLFSAALGKKVKKGVLDHLGTPASNRGRWQERKDGFGDILSAIRAAPRKRQK